VAPACQGVRAVVCKERGGSQRHARAAAGASVRPASEQAAQHAQAIQGGLRLAGCGWVGVGSCSLWVLGEIVGVGVRVQVCRCGCGFEV
jgi:hypothetical protein